MRYLSLFSGIEAASVAWRDIGWEPVAFCEIDQFCDQVVFLKLLSNGLTNLNY